MLDERTAPSAHVAASLEADRLAGLVSEIDWVTGPTSYAAPEEAVAAAHALAQASSLLWHGRLAKAETQLYAAQAAIVPLVGEGDGLALDIERLCDRVAELAAAVSL